MRAPTIPVRTLTRTLPKPIGTVLRRLDRRVRAWALLRGLGTTAVVVSLVVALGMTADFLWALPQAVRWGSWGAALVAILIAFALSVVRLTLRRSSAFDLAAVVERGHPAMGEQLTGAVALLGGGSPSHGSPRLIAAVADRAAEQASVVEPARVIPWRSAFSRLAMGLAALGLLAAPLLFWPDTYGKLGRHFLMPWADVERPGRHVLAVLPGDRALPFGADLSVSAAVRSRLAIDSVPREAWLHWSAEGERVSHRVAMPVVPGKQTGDGSASMKSARDYAVTLPRLARSISYHVESGSVKSPRYLVTVVEPPAVVAISARVEPPAYTKLPAVVAADASRIDAFEGSRVTLDIKASRAVRSIEVEWPVDAVESESATSAKVAAVLRNRGEGGSVTVDATRTGAYSVSLCDELGIASRADEPRRVVVRADAPPVVAVRGPEGVKDVSPNDTLGLAIAARDDIAVASVELHCAIDRGDSSSADPETEHVAVALVGLGSRSARGEASLALGRFGLKPGDSLSYRVRVADNRPAPRGPNVVWSPAQTLLIVAAAEPLRVRASRARTSGLRSRLESLKKDVVADRDMTEQLRQVADAVRRGDGEWDESRRELLGEREAATRTIEDQLKLLARELGADLRMQPISRAAQQVAVVEAEAARAGLDQARREQDPAARHTGLERAVGRLGAVHERLQDLTRQFEVAGREEAEIGRLNELAKREEALAALAQTTNGDRAGSDRVQAEQQAVRNELDDLLRKTPALRALVLGEQVGEAERLAGRARALADRQREESRRTVETRKHAAELKELAEMQRDLEDDARKLAVVVDQPLGENGRGRVNTEGLRQAVEPIERGDVEGGRERLEGAENELRRLARDVADVQDDPKALAGRLFRRQDALNRDIDAAFQSAGGKDKALTGDEKAAFGARMKPLEQRQRAIAELAKTIQPPSGKEGQARFPRDAARDATAKTARAAEAMRSQKPREIEDRKNEARQALERLANELHDPWRRQEPTRQRFDEARRASNEVAEEIARNMRETDPRPDRPATTAGAAAELAQRLHATADKQARVVAALEAMEPEARALPQRERAVRRAQALQSNLRDLRDAGKREQARASLQATEIGAHVAMDRLEQKLGGRVPADDLAQELADDARSIQEAASSKQPAPDASTRGRAAADQQAIAGALRSLAVPDAAPEQAEAIRLAERAAHTLAAADAKVDPTATAAVREAAHAAQALADRLADRQKPPASPSKPTAAGTTKAAAAAGRARAAEPELAVKPEHADRAADLARRERRIRERLLAILGERAGPQQTIRNETAALGRELGDFGERVQSLSDRARYPAQEAANHLTTHSPRAMDEGVNHLAGGQARAARDDQRRAAELLERGAHFAEDVAAALRSEMPEGHAGVVAPHAGAGGPARTGEALGDARDQMRRASQELDQARDPARARASGTEAREAMRRAARDLQTAALQASASLGASSSSLDDGGESADLDGQANDQHAPSAGSTRDPKSGPGGKADADLTELKAQVRKKTGRAWGELPGHLRNEILKMQAGRYRDDYARVIQLYFREIAAGAATDEKTKP
jgi:hypothetical protein